MRNWPLAGIKARHLHGFDTLRLAHFGNDDRDRFVPSTSDNRWSAPKSVVSILFEHSPSSMKHLVPELASEPSPPPPLTSFTDLIDRPAAIIRSWPPALQPHRRQPFRRSSPWLICHAKLPRAPDPKIVHTRSSSGILQRTGEFPLRRHQDDPLSRARSLKTCWRYRGPLSLTGDENYRVLYSSRKLARLWLMG